MSEGRVQEGGWGKSPEGMRRKNKGYGSVWPQSSMDNGPEFRPLLSLHTTLQTPDPRQAGLETRQPFHALALWPSANGALNSASSAAQWVRCTFMLWGFNELIKAEGSAVNYPHPTPPSPMQ